MALSRILNLARTLLLDHSSAPPINGGGPYGTVTTADRNGELIKEGGNEMGRFVKGGFQMPLHYPRYRKSDYEKMEEWQIDILLRQYGLDFRGCLDEKRIFAMGAFLWPDQY